MSCAPRTLVVDTAHLGVRIVALHCRALEVGHCRGRLGHVEAAVPVRTSDGQEVLQSGRSEMREMRDVWCGREQRSSYFGLFCRGALSVSLVLTGLSATSLFSIWNNDCSFSVRTGPDAGGGGGGGGDVGINLVSV